MPFTVYPSKGATQMSYSALNAATAQLEARHASPFARAGLHRLIDEMIDGYVSWREECAAVHRSYENWDRAERQDRDLAYAAYRAALDREEHAAATYRSLAEQIPVT
jgi:hypothetical protein